MLPLLREFRVQSAVFDFSESNEFEYRNTFRCPATRGEVIDAHITALDNGQYYNGTQTSNLVVHQYYAAPFDDLPLLHPDIPLTMDTNLLYLDITLLQVALKRVAGGGREISWNSATGLTNVVEFTTNLPPVWTTLVVTNGTGARLAVVDSNAGPRRFYRVRVAY